MRCLSWLMTLFVMLAVSAAHASPTVEDQVQGTCRSPREAMLQLLYWVQDAEQRVDAEKAAACLDGTGLAEDERERRAVQLKRTLDARGVYIDVDALSHDPNYTNPSGIHRWRLPEIEDIEIVKLGAQWKFSVATVRKIPELHSATMPPFMNRLIENLPAAFHKTMFGLRIWQLCGILLIIILALTLQKLVVFLIGTYFRRAADRFALTWVNNTTVRIARPIGGLAMAAVFHLGGPWLQLSVHISQMMHFAIGVLAAASTAWLVYRLIDVLTNWLEVKASATQSKIDDQLVPLLRKTLKVFTAVIGTIFVLQNLDVDVGSLLTGLGLGGLAFALAARDTIANFFGSLVVFIDKPFQIGDWVVIGTVEGIVEEVGFRTTRVRTFYNSLITVPNAKLTDTAIDNYGVRRWRRYYTKLGITYDTPPQHVEAFCEGIRAIVQRLPGMRRDYALVEFNDFGDSGLVIMVYVFMDAPDWATELRTRTLLNVEILKLASDLGVSFAFPTRTLHIESQASPRDANRPAHHDDAMLADIVRRYGAPQERDREEPPASAAASS